MTKKFNIKEKNITDSFGNIQGIAEIVQITLLQYNYSDTVGACVILFNKENIIIKNEFNIYIETPKNWGLDDNILFSAFSENLGITILHEYVERAPIF